MMRLFLFWLRNICSHGLLETSIKSSCGAWNHSACWLEFKEAIGDDPCAPQVVDDCWWSHFNSSLSYLFFPFSFIWTPLLLLFDFNSAVLFVLRLSIHLISFTAAISFYFLHVPYVNELSILIEESWIEKKKTYLNWSECLFCSAIQVISLMKFFTLINVFLRAVLVPQNQNSTE